MPLVDSHCHLDDQKFQPDLEAVLGRAADIGVERMLAIGTGNGPPDLEAAIRLADRYPQIFATAGIHPHDASKTVEATFDNLRKLLDHPKVLALGEIGLDYHYDFSPRDTQRAVFLEQLRIAREAAKPIVIHTREAWADTMSLLRDSRSGVMHCFTGDAAQAREALDLGFHLSFGGVITFPKAEGVREAARLVPDDRLLIETDAPYLAPVPHRGKRNEPAFMIETARRLAAIRETTTEHIASVTSRNFERLFAIPPHPMK
ncbi:MAG: TatD family hydrolase [Bryobacteraceae bacterium]